MIFRNPRLLLVAVAAAISVVAMGITLIERVQTEQQFRSQAQSNCQAIEQLKGAITQVFEDGRDRVVARRYELDPATYRDSLSYYDRQLERFAPESC